HIEDDPIDEDHADDGGQNLRVGNNRSAALDRLETPVTTLDAYFAEHPPASRVGLFKCDVEGHEPHVFRGAARTITEHRPVMLFESHRAADPANEAFAVLGELGYRGYCFTRRGEQPVERYAELLDGLDDAAKHNFVFRPEAAAVKRAA
ncbi:MAG: FkbM family methyltransferase, partial [Planctomycetota bacterium]